MSTLPFAVRRLLVVGNSASGKSTLARAVATEHDAHHLDLDAFAWRPTTPPTRTPIDDAVAAIRAALDGHDRWVIEGCYADLLGALADDADGLVFLDPPTEVCLQRARARPWEPHKYATKAEQDANLSMLLDWIAAYAHREGPLGRADHVALYEAFGGDKAHLEA